jgi:hypothetical protein
LFLLIARIDIFWKQRLFIKDEIILNIFCGISNIYLAHKMTITITSVAMTTLSVYSLFLFTYYIYFQILSLVSPRLLFAWCCWTNNLKYFLYSVHSGRKNYNFRLNRNQTYSFTITITIAVKFGKRNIWSP